MTTESTSYSYSFTLPSSEVATVSFSLYERIANPLQLIELFTSKNIQFAMLNAKMIVSLKQLLIALNRIYQQKENLSSKSLIFYISPESTKAEILESFKALDFAQPCIIIYQTSGLSDSALSIVDQVETTVKGEELSISKIGTFFNLEHIKKIYGISDKEASLDTDIRGSLYNIIASKKLK